MKIRLLLLSLLVSFGAFAQNIDAAKIDDYISHIEKNNRDVGSVSIFKDGKQVYNRSFGQQNIPGLKADANTKYQIGSISKLFTAVMLFQLVEKGQLALDEKLADYFPQIPNANKITIKNLLEHSSGLGDYAGKEGDPLWLTKKVSEQQIFDEIIKQGIEFEPGADRSYSNSAYYLLVRILEKKYKSDYASILQKQIIAPLQLKNIDSYNPKNTNFFKSYAYTTKWEAIDEFEFSNVIGVGDIVATTQTLNAFMEALFQYKILKKETVEMMKPNNEGAFGRGLMLIPFYEVISYGHGGDTFGTHSVAAYTEKDKMALSFSINGERYPHNDFAIGLLSIIYGKDHQYPDFKEAFVHTTEEMDLFLGVYSANDFPLKITITKEGNTLLAQGTGQPSFALECYGRNKFKFDQAKLKIEFVPAENKLILNQLGNEFEMKKE